ncbi:MAG: hypothetical protein CL844_01015 [Crocinitomicaceae bacterium]|nr:hypothetical protein [Crocinitomicaceae bacterium]|tara:strand:+ start:43106 stop:43576 length:471 start_codon:yes stop_codon:yes gene_type:complete
MIKSLVISLIALNLTTYSIDKLNFYKVFESNSESLINIEIQKLRKLNSSNTKDAYLGALLMKKAKFQKNIKEKIEIFKQGKSLLEKAIQTNPKKIEYRFLRLVIQENCPKILKYNSEIIEDSETIHNSYQELEFSIKKVVKKYAQKSKNLNPKLLQ